MDTSLTKSSYTDFGFPAYSASGKDGFLPHADFNENGIVLSAIGARCGLTFLTPKKWSAIKNTITIHPIECDLDYIFQTLNYGDVWYKSGGAQPFISLGDARKTKIHIPPLPEQKKIAAILTSVDDVIENTQAQIAKLQDLKKATMNELLAKGIGHTEFKDSELGRIPSIWKTAKLNNFCKIEHGFPFQSQFFSRDPSDPILLSPGNFNVDGSLYFGKNTKHYNGDIPSNYRLSDNDLMVVMTDLTSEMSILGNAVLLSSRSTVLHNQRIGKVYCDDGLVTKGFLRHLLNSQGVKALVRNTATGTTVRHPTSPIPCHLALTS